MISLLFKKVRRRGGGCLFEGGAYLLFWPRGWALIRGGRLLERGRLFEEIRYALTGNSCSRSCFGGKANRQPPCFCYLIS